ncbi:hypothetical protein RHS03_07765, partial [Rhizoctonia solani]
MSPGICRHTQSKNIAPALFSPTNAARSSPILTIQSHEQSQQLPGSQVNAPLPSYDDSLTHNNPLTIITKSYSRAWDMLQGQHAIASALASLASAKADYIHACALRARTNVLQQLVSLEQQEQAMQLRFAMDVMHITKGNNVTHNAAHSWVNQTFFTSHPLDNFTQLVKAWKAELALEPSHSNCNSDYQSSTPTTPPMPEVNFAELLSELGRA